VEETDAVMVSASRSATPALCCLGRLGDITAALPLAQEMAYEAGAPVPFIVAREFAPLIQGASYANPNIFDGHFSKLAQAQRQFANRFSRIAVAQTYASDAPWAENLVTDSFVKEAWHRAGMLPKFGLPLVFDRRDATREAQIAGEFDLDSSPYIVVHRGGFSSPYPFRQELMLSLKGLRVIDITGLTCSAPYDLLAVLERASCAILADSFPLHLSFACRDLPVIALQTDSPNNWFGAPERPNWIAHYRYQDSKLKVDEIAELASKQKRSTAKHFTFPAGAYNASIIDDHGKRLLTWRYHPKTSAWQTRLAGSDGGRTCEIVFPAKFDDCSREDARLFEHNGKTHISFTLAKTVSADGKLSRLKDARCVVGYGELTRGVNQWQVKRPIFVQHGQNNWQGTEKNWVFWSQDGKLYCLYASAPEQVVLEVKGSQVIAEHKSPAVTWAFGKMRGDTAPLPYDDESCIRFFHSRVDYPSRKFRYLVAACLMKRTAPFETFRVSKPLFVGDDTKPNTLFHSKQSVVFCCGAIRSGNHAIAAISRNDDNSDLVEINLDRIFV
jgi:hypothetical protein